MSDHRSKILFIAGIGRSGSTLLSRMLAQIEGFQAMGELHHLWQTRAPLQASDELCGCGSSYAECRFWPRVIETALGPVDRGVGRPVAPPGAWRSTRSQIASTTSRLQYSLPPPTL